LRPNEAEEEIQQFAEWGEPWPPSFPPSIGPFSVATERLRNPLPSKEPQSSILRSQKPTIGFYPHESSPHTHILFL
jgi:hypothetical protein